MLVSVLIGVAAGTAKFGWARLHPAAVKPTPVYGVREADLPSHWEQACTEAAYNTDSTQWVCMSMALLRPGVRIVAPAPYTGRECGHVEVNQTEGSWMCVGEAPPPPSTLPPGVPLSPAAPSNAT